jgi:hypothetical protein
MVRTSPEGYPMPQAPGKVVPGVGVNSLEQPEDDPDVDGDNVKVGSEETVEERSTDGTHAEDEDLKRVGVLGGETERCAVLVVHLVNVLVEGTVVECSMSKVVPGILEDEEEGDLGDDRGPGGEGNGVGSETKVFSHGMEAPDLMAKNDTSDGKYRVVWNDVFSTHLRQFDGEVTEQDSLGTLPHLSVGGDLGGLKLILAEHGHLVDDDPRDASTEVDDL